MIIKKKCLFVFFIFCCAVAIAQQDRQVKVNDDVPTACGRATMELSAAHQSTIDGKVVIIISRLGDGENDENLHYKRLNTAKEFLIETWKRSPETIVIARGEKTSGLGKLEIYTNGSFNAAIKIKKKGNLITKCD